LKEQFEKANTEKMINETNFDEVSTKHENNVRNLDEKLQNLTNE